MPSPEPRVPPLPESEWNDEVRSLLEPLRAMGGGRVYNVFSTLARHPELLRRWLGFGTHVLLRSTLAARERELVILRVGWLCRAEYEWAQHVPMARQVGVTPSEIERVAAGPDAPGWSASDADLLRAVDELHSESRIGDATWARLRERLDTRQLLDLVFTVGQYVMVSMALNSLRVPLDPGLQGFPEPR